MHKVPGGSLSTFGKSTYWTLRISTFGEVLNACKNLGVPISTYFPDYTATACANRGFANIWWDPAVRPGGGGESAYAALFVRSRGANRGCANILCQPAVAEKASMRRFCAKRRCQRRSFCLTAKHVSRGHGFTSAGVGRLQHCHGGPSALRAASFEEGAPWRCSSKAPTCAFGGARQANAYWQPSRFRQHETCAPTMLHASLPAQV